MYQHQLSFKETVKRALTVNYCNIAGRASLSEFLWYTLFYIIVNLLILPILIFYPTLGVVTYWIVINGLFLPGWSIIVRRLHDVGTSGWLSLIGFIPLNFGLIILLFWLLKPSEPRPNQYGPVPNIKDNL